MESQVPPPSWCRGKMSLIHKSGSTNDPANFRPIALTSVVGKLFHKIIARRMEYYLIQNGIIDTATQKGFLSGVNGMFEHIYTINAILDNAKTYNLPLAMTFIDLKNAFGSVSHKLIQDLLHYVKVPVEIRYYIHNLYTNLSAFISTNHWSTGLFPINKGVFQGDTLSPLIFLLSQPNCQVG